MGTGATILVVDDDPGLNKTLSAILKAHGYSPLTAADGRTAVDMIGDNQPDVALIDLRLPDIDGLAVMQRIREGCPDTECIVLTGYASQATAIEAIDLGAYSYVQKPYDPEQLLVTIRRALEKRGAVRALRDSEHRYRQLVDDANDIIYSHDLEGNFTSANPAARRVYGYTAEELLRMNIAQIVESDYLPLAQEKIREKVEGSRQTEPYELLTHSKAGTPVWVEVSTRVVQRDEQPVGVHGIARDITDRKQAQEAVERLMDLNEGIVQNMAEGIVIEDVEGHVTFANPASATMLGYETEELVGQHWTAFTPPDQHEILQAADERRARGETDHYELQMVRKDGKRVPVLVSGSPRFEEGRFAGTLAVFTEITELKQAEQELQRSHEELRRAMVGTIRAVAGIVEARDAYTAGHQRRVAQLAAAMAEEMGLSLDRIDGIRMAGLIHDIGKIYVPAEILSKPAALIEPEMKMIQTHAQVGHDALKTVEFPWPVAQTVLQHHERMDGSGYPQGLSGEDILLEARIMAVADVVEAMASHRPYRPARGIDKALEEVRDNRGILYDPEAVDACVRLFTEKGFELEDA